MHGEEVVSPSALITIAVQCRHSYSVHIMQQGYVFGCVGLCMYVCMCAGILWPKLTCLVLSLTFQKNPSVYIILHVLDHRI